MDDRRGFLKLATCAIGGGVGLVVVAPVVRLVLDPAGKQTVITPAEPIDLGPVERFGATPTRVEVRAPRVTDGWTSARDVLLGAAFVRRVGATVDAKSGICPHLGCAITLDGTRYLCPCHDSRFELTGEKLSGPSERALDALPVEVTKDGRLRLTWERYKPGQATKERV